MNICLNLSTQTKAEPHNSHSHGQLLIEIIIAVAVLMMFTHAFFTLIIASYQILAQSRAEATARALANEQMELIRNLSYDNVGTIGGIPNGPLDQEQVINRNGQLLTVKTSIVYQDDPFDGVAPNDTLPIDYKKARVEITWQGFPTNQELLLVSNISPKGVETTAGGGTISLLVFDSQGQPVPQANVHIESPTTNPAVDLNLTTDNMGNLVLPGAPVCTDCYNITVTKENYSTDRTYTTTEVTNPSQPPLTVLEGQVTQGSFAVDRLSHITFNSVASRELDYTSLGNIDFHLTSSKQIGTNSDEEAVYKIDQDYTTDSTGQLQFDLEWDNYTLTLNNTTYNLGGSNPFSPLTITADNTLNIAFIAIPQQTHSLLLQVQDASGSAVASASARLFDGVGYDETLTTGDYDLPDLGQTFFSPLTSTDYTLEVISPDLNTATSSVSISGPQKEIVILNPN